jgi:hypothetical protein
VATAMERRSGVILVSGLVGSIAVIFGILLVVSSANEDAIGALIIGPTLYLVSLPVFSRRAKLDGDQRLFWILSAALLLKFAGSLVRYYVAFDVYGGEADASVYHEVGTQLARGFHAGDLETGLVSLTGTDFISFFTGLVYTVTGPVKLGGFLVFSWLGFWGLFLFYRAYLIAVPGGRTRNYALLVFFLPSLLYWPSSIGKEAWMMFSLGVAAVGVARILTGNMGRGLVVAGVGMWFASLVRPHVAGLVAIALVVGYLFRLPRAEPGRMLLLGKAVTLLVLGIMALFVLIRTDQFLEANAGVKLQGGVGTLLESTAERTSIGGSQFTPSVLESPVRAPVAVVTVLYRPLVIEAHNLQALATAAEGTLLLAFTLTRIRWLLAALRSIRRQPYVAFVLAYVALFIVAFSSIANFGLLARERVQVLPLALVLLTIPPRARKGQVDAATTKPQLVDASRSS